MIWKYAFETDSFGSMNSMISPRERNEREEFWKLAEEIGEPDIHSNTFFQRFFRNNDEWAGEK